ncbi:MAG: PIG-L family deacetylase [Methanobrevibacter sp.]|jgi:hypothetical protein|nr:PIG-L family deacetylase [Candidatus Methanovirga procula]
MNKSVLIIFTIIILLSCTIIALFGGNTNDTIPDKYNGTIEIKSNDRIIVFSPHPDDDILANSGLIQEALRKGAEIKVVFMTVGDALDQDYFNSYLKSQNITNFKGNIW